MTLLIESKPLPLIVNEHGTVMVRGTRIPLDTIVYAFRNGDSPEEIIEQFDTLKLADVYAIISYYLDYQNEVDAYIRQREVEAQVIRQEIEARFPPHGLRERLLARRAKEYA